MLFIFSPASAYDSGLCRAEAGFRRARHRALGVGNSGSHLYLQRLARMVGEVFCGRRDSLAIGAASLSVMDRPNDVEL